MQTNSTTNATISALRSLLSGNASALNSSVSAQPSFQILAVNLTAARPQTNANAQEQQTLTSELSALANRDGRFSHITNLIRAALQSYSLANNPATSDAARVALQNRAQRALAQAQRELDELEASEQGTAAQPTPARRTLPSLPQGAQGGEAPSPQGATQTPIPHAASIPPLPVNPIITTQSTADNRAVNLYHIAPQTLQSLAQRMERIVKPRHSPAAPQQDGALQAIRELAYAAQNRQPLPADSLDNPSQLLQYLSYLISYDLAALRIDNENPAALLRSVVNEITQSPLGIKSGLNPLQMVALLLKTLRELATTQQGQAPLQQLMASLNGLIQRPIPAITLLQEPQSPSSSAPVRSTLKSVTLEELLLSAFDTAENTAYADFCALANYAEQACGSRPVQTSRDYLSYYLAGGDDSHLNTVLGSASSCVLMQLRYVIECFIQGFHAIAPVQAITFFPAFAAPQAPAPL
ncbi:MAG: hypothetical protein ACRC7P_05840, partial [Enterovibrio sp.]